MAVTASDDIIYNNLISNFKSRCFFTSFFYHSGKLMSQCNRYRMWIAILHNM